MKRGNKQVPEFIMTTSIVKAPLPSWQPRICPAFLDFGWASHTVCSTTSLRKQKHKNVLILYVLFHIMLC